MARRVLVEVDFGAGIGVLEDGSDCGGGAAVFDVVCLGCFITIRI